MQRDGLVEGRLPADGRSHRPFRAQSYLVERHHVERVGHGDHEGAVVVEAEGQQAVTDDEVARQKADGGRAGRDLAQIGDLEVKLPREGAHEVGLGDERVADQHLAQAATVGLLTRERRLELELVEEAAGDEQRAELEAPRVPLAPAVGGRAQLLAQLVEQEGLGDEVGGAVAVRDLERGEVLPCGEHDERHAAQLGAGQGAQDGVAVEVAEADLGEHDVGRALAQSSQGRGVSPMDVDLVEVAEVLGELLAQVGVVVDDEETLLGGLSQGRSSGRFVESIGRRGHPLEHLLPLRAADGGRWRRSAARLGAAGGDSRRRRMLSAAPRIAAQA